MVAFVGPGSIGGGSEPGVLVVLLMISSGNVVACENGELGGGGSWAGRLSGNHGIYIFEWIVCW